MKFKPYLLICILSAFASCRSHQFNGTGSESMRDRVEKNDALFFNAENARVLGDTKQALLLYTEYVKKNPENATARYNLARLQFQKMDLSSAEKNAASATKLDPENKFFRELYTQILVLNKKPSLASTQYDILLNKFPNDEEYLYDKAMLQILMKEYDGAIRSFCQLERSLGFNEDIILQKKDIFIKQGKTEQAIFEINKLKQEDHSSAKYDLLIADVYANAKQTEKVKEILAKVEQDYSNDPLAQIALAQYYLELKDSFKYNHFMQLVMKNRNLDVETKIALIIPALKQSETDTLQKEQVIGMAKSIAEESSTNKDAISLYADVLYFSKKYDTALDEYKKYLKIDQQKFSIWSQIISIYSERQQVDSVISIGKQCIEIFQKNAIPYFYVGVSLLQIKQTDSAIHYLNLGLPFEKENKLLISQFYSSLGEAYNSKKNYLFSDSCFEQAIALQPSDATAMNNYAYYLSIRKERLEMAEKMSKKSLEIMPTSKSFLDTYGWILFQQGNYKEAERYIKQAIESDGENDGTLFEHLGDVNFKLGNTDKAIQCWKKANSKGENNPTLLKKIVDGKYYE